MKRIYTILFTFIILLVVNSCTKEEPIGFQICGMYINQNHLDNENGYLDTLIIEPGKEFSHSQGTDDYILWYGHWYCKENENIIVFEYLTETYYKNHKKVYFSQLENDYCYGQLDGEILKYKEYYEDDWEDYEWFIKVWDYFK